MKWPKKRSVQFSSVTQSCLTLCNPMNRTTPDLPVHHQLLEFTQTHVHWVGDAISHLILCRPLLLLPPIPPSLRVFSNESTLRMRWPKYWSFSFSIIPFKEIPGLISFRMDWEQPKGVLFLFCVRSLPCWYHISCKIHGLNVLKNQWREVTVMKRVEKSEVEKLRKEKAKEEES